MTVRTSRTHPLRVDAISLGAGELGMTFCPGKHATSLAGDPWERDLETDVDALRDWGTAMVVTLIETHEMVDLGVTGLGEVVQSRGIDWRDAPIPDGCPPDAPFEADWPELAAELTKRLTAGERVVVHCRGGLGRAGTVAAMMLMEFGATPDEAISRVRDARPGAIETRDQERYLRRYAMRSLRGHS